MNRSVRISLLLFVCLMTAEVHAQQVQQWSGNVDTTSTIGRTGFVGIGTSNPAQQLHVVGSIQVDGTLYVPTFVLRPSFGGIYAYAVVERGVGGNGALMFRTGGTPQGYTNVDWMIGKFGSSENLVLGPLDTIGSPPMTLTPAGSVGIGTNTPAATKRLHVVGEVRIDGDTHVNGTLTGTKVKAHYQDLAEWVPATDDLQPGTVVVLSRRNNNEVTASSESYDTRVAGVVSADPGIILGIGGEGMEQIATTGRVKVRVDATASPIAIGDLLVTGKTSGTAMKSEPMLVNGRAFHQPGTIIGKALEPLTGGTGEILVLLSMQ